MVTGIILSIALGVTIVLSRVINARLSEHTTPEQSTLANYVVGFSGAVILLFFTGGLLPHTLALPSGRDFYFLIGGFIGVLSIFINNKITSKLPSLILTLLLFCGQLFTGIILDYLFLNIFSFSKFVGGALVLAGVWVSSLPASEC